MDGRASMDEEYNINGSYRAIEGITSPDGRCFGKMTHAERRDDGVAVNIYGEQDMKIFESGVRYFRYAEYVYPEAHPIILCGQSGAARQCR